MNKKRNRLLIITSIVALVIALIFVVLGFALAGADVLGWFTSKWAFLFYTVYGCYMLVILYILIGDKIKKL